VRLAQCGEPVLALGQVVERPQEQHGVLALVAFRQLPRVAELHARDGASRVRVARVARLLDV
jgi:hypothetical protein